MNTTTTGKKKIAYWLLSMLLLISLPLHMPALTGLLGLGLLFGFGAYFLPILAALTMDVTFAYNADWSSLYGYLFTSITVLASIIVYYIRTFLRFDE